MKKKVKVTLILFALIVMAAVGVAVLKTTSKEKTPPPEIFFPVETATAEIGDITDYIKINGDVEAARSIDIYPDVSGKLKNIYISIGNYIERDKVVADVDPSKPGLSYALSPVRSTLKGTVTAIPYKVGDTVSPTTPIATIGDLSFFQIEAEVSEADIGKVKMGAKGILSFVAWPGNIYNAHIVEINPVVDAITRTMTVKFEFDISYPEIRAGMFASIKLLTETKEDVLLIPFTSVITSDDRKSYVFTVSPDSKAVVTPVEIGLAVDGFIEIISGITDEDQVVTNGQTLLEEGALVRVINAKGEGS